MKSNNNTRSMIAAVAARQRNAAAATRNATANGNNKKSVSFQTIKNQTQRIGENSTMTKIAAAAKRRQLFSTANGHKNTTDDEGKIIESSVAANPPSHINIGENSKMTKIAAAAKRRQLFSTANGHKNTTDDEGKIVESVAANPPSHINIGENSKMTKIAAAAKRRQLSSTANGHKNTTDNEGKIRENAVATVDREQQVIQRMQGGGGNDTGPSGSPREWPVCASFSDDLNNGCYMSKNGGSEFLNRDCYDPNDAENPKLRCDACKKPLHSALCAPSHSEDRAKLICKLCVAAAMETAAAAKVAKALAASHSRTIVAGPAAASASALALALASASASTSTSTLTLTLTSTSGTRKNDAKALYAWIVNASVGNSLRFTVGSTVGSTRRKNMDILVKNLIDTNTGLSFTENLSGRILTIKIRSKPSSAVIVPAVEDKPPKWRKSEAKEYVKNGSFYDISAMIWWLPYTIMCF
ncbi:hypothetical protein FRACYDRAFT_243846 [Fragilariopsis cylindrus CCMP1102]|uniref:Uncharacterized protein n=1 Tax=Fragilariopsis cylindrus CCMP1102 TaxID=635003 RepID=A0A1E7F417_9STRA|nr:hypothetical protein FRACYDRAFT_243846 [Fragilariopsis cylindrus CCMP1102]|eukprot:OEU12593.1 hypothetical protein FRACYDRAFT_243846 [Fragilariopsis cylindrus CCMP1102]